MNNENYKLIREYLPYFIPGGLAYKGFTKSIKKGKSLKASLLYGLGLEASRMAGWISPIPVAYTALTFSAIALLKDKKNLEESLKQNN